MSPGKALIVDDEPDIRELLTMTLEGLGLSVSQAGNTREALEMIANNRFNFCLTDMRLPDGDGFDIVDAIQLQCPQMPVAVITAHGNTDLAVEALKKGAFDFVSKPMELKRLRNLVETALAMGNERPSNTKKDTGLMGDCAAMNRLRQQIAKVARSQAPVFISGESGSGKELTARAIHYQGPRSNGAFIAVNCGAIPSELMESEFFGHKKGSFTGAIQDKQGLFHAADGGTLFLDEVADLPLAMQVKLLRAIQEKTVRPIGSQEEKTVDVRILSATHKNLADEVSNGRFREDLFYRINVIEIAVPPLRERSEDIPKLAVVFLERFARETQSAAPTLSKAALKALTDYSFPGNVRELENTLERAFTLCSGNTIDEEDLNLGQKKIAAETPAHCLEGQPGQDFHADGSQCIDDYLATIEKRIISQALHENRWNKTTTAQKLGISFRQLRYKLQKLGIE
ncbi:MAG: sigma-54 dependent transcriptional regulator [Porticoccaceae bacterium]|nr:sigma-54 dependent transcriptional regulator [Porticoccaceae bacterium]